MNNKKLLISLITVVFIGASGFVYCLGAGQDSDNDMILTKGAKESIVTEEPPPNTIDIVKQVEESEQDSYIYVHVCGEVKHPEVYKLKKGARVHEGIRMAGGFTKDAAVDILNQARELQDGEKIYVPSVEEEKELVLSAQMQSNLTENNDSNYSKVNINTANLTELMTIRGIGEAKAKSIVEYRETHGTFKSIDELKNITGIKDGVLDKIRDSITVD